MKKISRPVIAVIAVIVVVLASASVYAVSKTTNEKISEHDARTIALQRVEGASESDITKVTKDKHNGNTEYDIEIMYNGYEYEFEISAKDGSLIDVSKGKADAGDMAKTSTDPVVVQSKHHNTSSNHQNSDILVNEAKNIAPKHEVDHNDNNGHSEHGHSYHNGGHDGYDD